MESTADGSKDKRKYVFDKENVENDYSANHNEEAEISESDDDAVVPNFDKNASFHQVRDTIELFSQILNIYFTKYFVLSY